MASSSTCLFPWLSLTVSSDALIQHFYVSLTPHSDRESAVKQEMENSSEVARGYLGNVRLLWHMATQTSPFCQVNNGQAIRFLPNHASISGEKGL